MKYLIFSYPRCGNEAKRRHRGFKSRRSTPANSAESGERKYLNGNRVSYIRFPGSFYVISLLTMCWIQRKAKKVRLFQWLNTMLFFSKSKNRNKSLLIFCLRLHYKARISNKKVLNTTIVQYLSLLKHSIQIFTWISVAE